MDNQVLELKDIHLPAPISWWPLAPGWWILLASVLLLAIIVFFVKKIRQSKQLNREVETEIKGIKKKFNKTKNKHELAQSLSVLLRRSSISFYSENEVAGLTGDKWLAFLDKANLQANNRTNSQTSATHQFQSETGKVLLPAPYLPKDSDLNFDAQALIKLCEGWLKTQKVSTT
jgi:hypothetical protein